MLLLTLQTGVGWLRVQARSGVLPRSLLLAWGIIILGSLPAWGIGPDSPEVHRMIDSAKKVLTDGHTRSSPLEKLMAGYAMLKAGADASDPVVQAGVASCMADSVINSVSTYELSVALIYLANLDPVAHRQRIDTLLAHKLSLQQAGGAWGYRGRTQGDTSMTQLAVLCLWELDRKGIEVDDAVWAKAGNWLLRTQDPGGSFGYQANDPGHYNLVPQEATEIKKNSLAAGGGGSLYIVMEHFQIGHQEKEPSKSTGVPGALKPVVGKKPKSGNSRASAAGIDPARFQAAVRRCDEWHKKNFTASPKDYPHYYYYAYERYESFKAVAEGRKIEADPVWYSKIADRLSESQVTPGSWNGAHSSYTNTAFALLFLVRAAKKSIGQQKNVLGAGTLLGGHGIPKSNQELTERAGRLAPKPLKGPADQMLRVIDDPENPDHDRAVEGLGEYVQQADDATLTRMAAQFRKLASGKSPEARAVAVRGLARGRNLDDVPLLIAALRDPDENVATEAHQGLRFLSRKLSSVDPEVPAAGPERRLAMERWKNWYRSLRPNAEFLE